MINCSNIFHEIIIVLAVTLSIFSRAYYCLFGIIIVSIIFYNFLILSFSFTWQNWKFALLKFFQLKFESRARKIIRYISFLAATIWSRWIKNLWRDTWILNKRIKLTLIKRLCVDPHLIRGQTRPLGPRNICLTRVRRERRPVSFSHRFSTVRRWMIQELTRRYHLCLIECPWWNKIRTNIELNQRRMR